jgi:hypothetical protein
VGQIELVQGREAEVEKQPRRAAADGGGGVDRGGPDVGVSQGAFLPPTIVSHSCNV